MNGRDYFERDYAVVDFGVEPGDPEAAALRIVLNRLRQDLYAMQRAHERAINERDQWRQAYYRALREKAELAARTMN